MKYLQTFLLVAILMSFSATLSAQTSETITIRVMESNYKKWSKIIVADKLETIEIIDVTPSLVDPAKMEDVMVLKAQVLDKYLSQGYKIITSNGGVSAQLVIFNYILVKEGE